MAGGTSTLLKILIRLLKQAGKRAGTKVDEVAGGLMKPATTGNLTSTVEELMKKNISEPAVNRLKKVDPGTSSLKFPDDVPGDMEIDDALKHMSKEQMLEAKAKLEKAMKVGQEKGVVAKNAQREWLKETNGEVGFQMDVVLEPGDSERFIILSKSAKPGKVWQVSEFDEMGATGDSRHDTWAEAVEYIQNYYGGVDLTKVTTGAMEAQTGPTKHLFAPSDPTSPFRRPKLVESLSMPDVPPPGPKSADAFSGRVISKEDMQKLIDDGVLKPSNPDRVDRLLEADKFDPDNQRILKGLNEEGKSFSDLGMGLKPIPDAESQKIIDKALDQLERQGREDEFRRLEMGDFSVLENLDEVGNLEKQLAERFKAGPREVIVPDVAQKKVQTPEASVTQLVPKGEKFKGFVVELRSELADLEALFARQGRQKEFEELFDKLITDMQTNPVQTRKTIERIKQTAADRIRPPTGPKLVPEPKPKFEFSEEFLNPFPEDK